jgi:enoyl-CoA hydratase/carnithine racemase
VSRRVSDILRLGVAARPGKQPIMRGPNLLAYPPHQLSGLSIQDHIADVRLNRPDKMNAVNPDMWKAVYEAGASLLDNRNVRAVVLSGNGRAFCAGLDMASMQGMTGGSSSDGTGSGNSMKSGSGFPENAFQRAAMIWKRLPMPVICAIHGVAYGAGAQIALGADIRIVAPDMRFSVLEIKWGLIPDVGITQTLRDIVPLDVAKELTWTGRILDGAAAKELGIATRGKFRPSRLMLSGAASNCSNKPGMRMSERGSNSKQNFRDSLSEGLTRSKRSRLISKSARLTSNYRTEKEERECVCLWNRSRAAKPSRPF